MGYSMPGFSVLHCLPEFAQIHVHCVSDAICSILCHPFLLLSSTFPSISIFSNESSLCNRWPKYWSFSISPSNEYSGLLLLLSRFSRVRLLVTPRTAAYQAPPSMGFSRQEYWSGVPLPSPDKPRQYIKKQRHHIANKGPSSQGYGFSSGHVWM